ncbi:MAG: hypothetical protein A3F11_05345 [Gammaproteobacteria bacterium RIFCSPHIGHO2_12_FULL_37_14]|nr:MAG: hypothetical protein A3F11_05345 [Gammaproteobacteria bacterium RIFCSPHIGHO2_12_FULL_37_14]
MTQSITQRNYSTWQLVKLYWQSEERSRAYISFIVVMLMTMGLVIFDVVLSYWSNYFYNALQAYNKREVVYLLFVFLGLAACYMVLAVYRYYISQLFGLRWRKWLTEQFVNRWLAQRDYYYLEAFDEKTDNPDQRIQEDISALVSYSINLSIGFISAITTFMGFIYVLWSLSGEIVIPMGSWGTLHIYGYLVWVSLLYATIGTFITFKIGYPLVGLNFEQQRREATFRFAAIDLRSHAEHVALYQGENHQKNVLQRLFNGVLDNWYLIILRQKLLLWFTAGYNQLAVVLPLVVALPNYFSKVFMLGGLMQSLRSFAQIQDASSFFVNAYTQIAEWRAVTRRLITFLNHMHEIDEKVTKQNQLVFHQQARNAIMTKQLSIYTPRNELLLKQVNEEFFHGNHYLIKGVSGIGKSTFIRALAGIWPYASGEITLPSQQKIMYLPQKPYMPLGSLSEAILFPDKEHEVGEKEIQSILRDCRLEALIPRLCETAPWSEQLSPGEQQRISFARVLLHQPDWIFLDESTSMLDLGNEEYLYKLLKTRLPHCSIVSVGHRVSLDGFHDHILDMAKYSV